MNEPSNPTTLQEITVFNLIYYMGRRGRESLRRVTKQYFDIGIDYGVKRFIFSEKKITWQEPQGF